MFYAYKPVLLAAVCTCFRNRWKTQLHWHFWNNHNILNQQPVHQQFCVWCQTQFPGNNIRLLHISNTFGNM